MQQQSREPLVITLAGPGVSALTTGQVAVAFEVPTATTTWLPVDTWDGSTATVMVGPGTTVGVLPIGTLPIFVRFTIGAAQPVEPAGFVEIEAASSDIITLGEAKDFLNLTSSATDEELAGVITAASAMWTRKVGPVTPTTYSEFYDGGNPTIMLRHTPVASVASVTESWGASVIYSLDAQVVDVTAGSNWSYSVDLTTGLLTRRSMGIATRFAPGAQNVHVVYQAGYPQVPADVRQAVKLLVGHMWETQRSRTASPLAPEDSFMGARAYTWPHRVEEIAAAYLVPGIA